jgi:hypothetical protein
VGQWPTPEGLVDRLVQAFNDAADHEEDAERHYQLRQASGLLGETLRDVAVRVAATVTGPPLASSPGDTGGPSAVGGPAVGGSSSAAGGAQVGGGPPAAGGA